MEKEFWENRWKTNETQWDIGYPSVPIQTYIDQLSDKELKILIPGCGNAYEAEYLMNKGFKNVYIIDISQGAIASFIKRVPNFNSKHIILGDFFELQDSFDLIVEQTFFCALHPSMRAAYVQKMAELLLPTGALVGLLFNMEKHDGPPFGGDLNEYHPLFSTCFNFCKIEVCYNSISPRANREFWIEIKSPKQ